MLAVTILAVMLAADHGAAVASPRAPAVQQRLGLSLGAEMGIGMSSDPTATKRGLSNVGLELAGLDIKTQLLTILGDHRFPTIITYLRSGYRVGGTRLLRDGRVNDRADLEVRSVPLMLGANIYPAADILFRPYAGPGIGVEIISLTYREETQTVLRDRAVHPTFDAHFGLEFRPHNIISLFAEARYVWGSTRQLAHVPDYTNNDLTITVGIAGSFAPKRRN